MGFIHDLYFEGLNVEGFTEPTVIDVFSNIRPSDMSDNNTQIRYTVRFYTKPINDITVDEARGIINAILIRLREKYLNERYLFGRENQNYIAIDMVNGGRKFVIPEKNSTVGPVVDLYETVINRPVDSIIFNIVFWSTDGFLAHMDNEIATIRVKEDDDDKDIYKSADAWND